VRAGTWTPELVAAALQDWAREFGEPPKAYEWSVSSARAVGHEEGRVRGWMAEYPRWPGTRAVVHHFGSWSAALATAGLREEPLAPWEMDLAERVETAQRLDRAGLLAAEIAGLLDVKPATVRAYLRAGACPDCGGPVVNAKSRRCQGCAAKRAHRPAWTAEEIIAALRDWAAEHGAPPAAIDWMPSENLSRRWASEYPRWPSNAQVHAAFGSWNSGLEAAGLEVHRRTWDRESILAAFQAFAERHRRSPRLADLKDDDGLPSRITVERHFGSLEALRDELGLEAERPEPRPKAKRPTPRPKAKRRAARKWLPPAHQRWDRDRIVAAIRAFADEHGRPPTSKDWKRVGEDHPAWGSVVRHFGSFGAALSAAGFAPRRFSWDREQIVAALNAHLREHGVLPTAGEWAERDPTGARPALHNVHHQFGSWDKALEAAGHPVERWDRHTLTEALQALGEELGRRPIRHDLRPKRPGRPGYDTVLSQFGSLTAALEAAGYEQAKQWSREETVAALRSWSAEHGSAPTYDDWRRGSDSHPGVGAVERLFGSWTEGLLAAGLSIQKRNWDREAIITALRAWAAEHGRPPASADWKGTDGSGRRPATYRVQREFGTWGAALREAGLV